MPRVDPLCGLQDKILPRATRRLPRQSDHDLRQLAACSSLVYPDRAAAGRNALQCTAQPSPAYCTVKLDLGTRARTGPTSLPGPAPGSDAVQSPPAPAADELHGVRWRASDGALRLVRPWLHGLREQRPWGSWIQHPVATGEVRGAMAARRRGAEAVVSIRCCGSSG